MNQKDIKNIGSLKFEEAMEQLENITKKLEEESLKLEESVELYKHGILLSQHCKQILEKAQGEIKILTKNEYGEIQEAFFEINRDENR